MTHTLKDKVSVIIPVYNAAKFLRQAVESAVHLPEVAEIILIEDRSPDNALEICMELVHKFSKVKMYQHPNNENRGAGASRNLGIEKSISEYVAFLDADDIYLPCRFVQALELLESDSSIDGVYDVVGVIRGDSTTPFKIYGVKKALSNDKLFYYLLRGKYGHFHTNGITIRKKILHKTGLFNVSLRLHQDSDLWLRLAFHGKIIAGELQTPVAFVRIHGNNRITSANNASKVKYWMQVDDYFRDKRVGLINRILIKRKLIKLRLRQVFRKREV